VPNELSANPLDSVYALVNETIAGLSRKKFEKDPIVDKRYSAITSIVSSAYKRHGRILEEALKAVLSQAPHLKVWSEPGFAVSKAAERLAENDALSRDAELPYNASPGDIARTLQIDLVVFNTKSRRLGAYECKRGFGYHDAGKKRSMLRDLRCIQMLLKNYGISKSCDASEATARMIFYYGQCSLGQPWALRGVELDAHFEWAVKESVELVNSYFRFKLHELLSKF
jgi:hypothetical protein